MKRLDVLILAAGLGTRMKSDMIKVLHRAAGRPLIDYVLELARSVSDTKPLLVVGHQREDVRKSCGNEVEYCVQEEQLGTGHAVLQAEEKLKRRGLDQADVLVLSGDVPLTRTETLRQLVEEHRSSGHAVTLLTMELEDPGSYGRIVRDDEGNVLRIVEAKDATAEELEIREVNAGIYLFDETFVYESLHSVGTDNAQGEYYLTDVVEMAAQSDRGAGAVIAHDPIETFCVNSRADLARIEQEIRDRTIEQLMTNGVTFRNPATIVIDSRIEIGRDSIVYNGICLEGKTTIGERCTIETGVVLRDCTVGDDVHLKAGTVAESAKIESGAAVGPCAHLRPGTVLGKGVKVGNFVETKKAVFGDGAKASHLSYIGDAEVGADVNIGAGTITCNYDGVNKHKTILEDGVFVGSDTQLVAPVRVGKGAYIGAGSTITKDVPPNSLALSRPPQKIHPDWATKRREQQEKEKESGSK
ncbi:MAG: bifunctional UDP-N-acetylglucosamine diphosphorylase/glucosamine-1-phosphate N-acetyltransferase GlmU [Thermoanaerobaculia bacterium]|nr:bifunctional UDP-N-acetylglucosamine diphosphorylase/glucosamine-1-phosphate N-acetyltransferase GlmU [Thermoanaerobaculia bacterium]